MKLTTLILCAVLLLSPSTMEAQTPMQQPMPQQPPEQPELPRELQLERDNLILQVRINELEAQLAALKAQLVNERVSAAAPAMIQKLQAAAPDWVLDPQTLTFTKKQTSAATAPAPAAPTTPAQPRP